MRKSVVILLVLVFLTGTVIVAANPVSAADLGSWTYKAPMQEARSGLGVATTNGKIYAIGGDTRKGSWPYTGGIVGTNEEYDPATNTWVFKTPMPTPRKYFGIAVFNNKIYCIGGESSSGFATTGVNEVYDPATDTWETKEPMPTPRDSLRANVVNGKLYLIGGIDENGDSTLNEVYDPATDSWTTKTPVPQATSAYASAVFGDKIYVIGGSIEGFSDGRTFYPNQIYNTENDSWSYGAYLYKVWGGYPCCGVTSGFMAPQRIYFFGEMMDGYGVSVYNPESDVWIAGADIPSGRGEFGIAVLDDLIYVIGGVTATGTPYDADPPRIIKHSRNEVYMPIGFGTVPPEVLIVSPENANYTFGEVQLNFTVNRHVWWMGYSLNGQDNVAISDNATLSGLTIGFHSITVYVRDEFGNMGASETVFFTIVEPEPEPEPFPVTLVIASVITAAVVGVGLLVYFKKLKVVSRERQ